MPAPPQAYNSHRKEENQMLGAAQSPYKTTAHDTVFINRRHVAIQKYGFDIQALIAWELGMTIDNYRRLCREWL
jgi:hypothetical protein